MIHAAVLACATVIGCQSAGKSSGVADNRQPPPASRNNNDPFWAQGDKNPKSKNQPTVNVPADRTPVQPASPTSSDEPTGVIAGRVVDPYSRPVGAATVQIQPADGSGEAARDVESSAQGHFYIRGLTPGRSYRVQAKLKQDGKAVGGEVVCRAPDARVLIPVSAEFVATQASERPAPPAAELGAPQAKSDFYPPPAPEVIAGNEPSGMPKANIPGFGSLPGTTPAPAFQGGPSIGPVPDCLINGGKLLTLRLKDTEDRTWDFSQHQGKVVLFDLWGTWCGPCMRAIPDLVRLQQVYRLQGLEVIGIACENGNAGQNLARVQKARRTIPSINYRILLAGEPETDPVRAQFRPAGYPCLVLVDGDGTILWRGVGGNAIGEAEAVIRKRLGP
ncbi:MAG: carboxypeptidase regulatory-like domain-containing protein [Gemmataceae bacterium]|nr:carboxypeptidase regulatory-like domain-containing protein [Gemmataceae bacterium]